MASSFSYCYSHLKIRLVPLDVVHDVRDVDTRRIRFVDRTHEFYWHSVAPPCSHFRRHCFSARDDGSFTGSASSVSVGIRRRTVVQAPCQISFGLVSSRAPGTPSSRPYPEALKPPNGARGSERVKSLINTIPDSISPATRRALARSRLQTAALRPKSVILARRIASSSVLKGKIIATGPKNSSLAIAASGGSPTSTVGG